MPRKVFVANEILTAGAVNTNLMDQAVMVFADAAARTAALGSPSEGMVTYLEDSDSLELYTTSWGPVSPAITRADLPAGSVLQVVSTTKTDAFTATGTTFQAITGLTATITPSSTSSKIMVMVNGNYGAQTLGHVRLTGGNTSGYIGDTSGSKVRSTVSTLRNDTTGDTAQRSVLSAVIIFLDSPATTSSVTYGVDISASAAGQPVYLNRSFNDADNSSTSRTASSITVMEVAG